MPQIVNFELLKNPLNWATIVLMVALFTVGVDLVRRYSATAPE